MTYNFSLLRSAMAMDAIGTSDTLQVVVKIGAILAAQLVLGHPTNLAVYAKGNM